VVDLDADDGEAEVRPVFSRSRVSVHLVKEEEDNCKQEEEERDHPPALAYFGSLQEYLMAMDLQLLIADSRKNSLR
jgi:hypothetical protein